MRYEGKNSVLYINNSGPIPILSWTIKMPTPLKIVEAGKTQIWDATGSYPKYLTLGSKLWDSFCVADQANLLQQYTIEVDGKVLNPKDD